MVLRTAKISRTTCRKEDYLQLIGTFIAVKYMRGRNCKTSTLSWSQRYTLDKLKKQGLRLAVVTDADSYHALARLTRVELLDSFDTLIAADMTGTKKPDPAHFLFAMQALDTKPEESLVVGDSIRRDIVPALKLRMKTAYASYGDWRPVEEMDLCFDFRLNTFSDLLKCIEALNRFSL